MLDTQNAVREGPHRFKSRTKLAFPHSAQPNTYKTTSHSNYSKNELHLVSLCRLHTEESSQTPADSPENHIIQTRRHRQRCLVPDIYIDNEFTRKCRACDSVCPPVSELVGTLGSGASITVLPPDKPHGEFNLW
jgi:hypothetical protein